MTAQIDHSTAVASDPGVVVCPHHAVPAGWDWTPSRVGGWLSITYRFPCCDYRLQVNRLPVPGIHEPLPEAQRQR